MLEFAKVIYIFESFKVKLKGGEVMSVKSLQFVNGFQNASIYAKIWLKTKIVVVLQYFHFEGFPN